MRFLAGSLLLVIVVTGCSKNEAPKPALPAEAPALLARYHFIGTAAVAADTNAAKLTNVWALPTTRAFSGATFDKLAGSLRTLWIPKGPTNAADHAAELRPLLEELIRVESCGEWRSTSTGTLESLLAIRLPEDRASIWSAALASAATNWSGRPIASRTNTGGGWQLRRDDPPKVLQFGRVGGWIVIGAGDGNLPLFDAAIERATKKELPVEGSQEGWLTATVDLPRLARRAAFDSPVRLGTVQLTGFGREENVRFEGSVRYENPLQLNLPDWQVPMNSIYDPLTGFTAIRGLAGLLTRTNWFRDWGMTNVPNQIVSWAILDAPFLLFAATPLPGPANLLAALDPKLNSLARSNLTPRSMTSVRYDSADASLRTSTNEPLPFISPFALPMKDNGLDYLQGGFLPGFTNSARAPQELFAAFQAKTNLLYYDWELTEDRLTALRQLSQLFCLVTGRYQAADKAPGWLWVPEVAPLLGETVTTVSLQSPTELRFTRRGHLGLTGAEITLLVRIFDAKGFPFTPFDWFERDPAAFSAWPRRPGNPPERNP